MKLLFNILKTLYSQIYKLNHNAEIKILSADT